MNVCVNTLTAELCRMKASVCLPHWSVCGSGVWLGLRRWRRPCCSPRAHTHRVSLRCVSAGVFSDSPDASMP